MSENKDKEKKEIKEETTEKEIKKEDKKQDKKKSYKDIVKGMKEEELEEIFERAEKTKFYIESLQRVKADFDNYQKRMIREKENYYKYSLQDFIKNILGILDHLERAIDSASKSEVDKNFYDGISIVYKEFQKILTDEKVVEIKAMNERFDPNFHEAMQQQESDEHPDMTVIYELEKGYMLHDRVLRPSRVIVSRKPQPKEEAKEEPKKEIQEPKKEKAVDKKEE